MDSVSDAQMIALLHEMGKRAQHNSAATPGTNAGKSELFMIHAPISDTEPCVWQDFPRPSLGNPGH